MVKGLFLNGESDYIEVTQEGYTVFHLPVTEFEKLLKTLPQDRWYTIIWDSDGDFLITDAKHRDILPDLFCMLKKGRHDA